MGKPVIVVCRAGVVLFTAATLCLIALSGCSRGGEEEVVVGSVGLALDEHMSLIEPYGFSGALLVARAGEPLLKRGYGSADDSRDIANTVSTVFSVGSLTKQFTAAAILRMEMDGLLSIDDGIGEFFEDVPEDKRAVTVKHLLMHTAGVVGSTGDPFEEVGRDEVVRRVMAAPLGFGPGNAMFYSEAGYSLLAAVVEIASGMTYEQYLRDKLFEPAGMASTGYTIPEWDPDEVARCYDGLEDNGTLLARPYPHWNLMGNGGIMSTLGDMFRWYEALKGESILDAGAKLKLWTPRFEGYACGWQMLETPRGKLIQSDGASELGASADLRWFVEEDLLIILFCNRTYEGGPLFEVVRQEIEELAFGGTVSAPPPVVEMDEEFLERFVGSYKMDSGGGLRIMREGKALRLLTFNQDVINAIFQPDADPDTFNDLNARTGRLIAAAVSGNHEVFAEELGDEGAAKRVEGLIGSELRDFARRTQAEPLASVCLGTVPAGEAGIAVSSIRLKNTKGDGHDISLWWRDGKLIGIDGRGFAVSIPLAPVSESQFVGYHLAFARVHPMSFESDETGAVETVAFGSRTAKLVRRPGHHHDHHHDHGHEHVD